MKVLGTVIQRILSFTLIISLLGILLFEMKGGIQLKQSLELYQSKSTHFSTPSPIFEENDEVSLENLLAVNIDFTYYSTFTFISQASKLHANTRAHASDSFPSQNLYITFRNFRI